MTKEEFEKEKQILEYKIGKIAGERLTTKEAWLIGFSTAIITYATIATASYFYAKHKVETALKEAGIAIEQVEHREQVPASVPDNKVEQYVNDSIDRLSKMSQEERDEAVMKEFYDTHASPGEEEGH